MKQMSQLLDAYNRTIDPQNFFRAWSDADFMDWLTIREPYTTEADHFQVISDLIVQLEQAELYELCHLAKRYQETLSPIV